MKMSNPHYQNGQIMQHVEYAMLAFRSTLKHLEAIQEGKAVKAGMLLPLEKEGGKQDRDGSCLQLHH